MFLSNRKRIQLFLTKVYFPSFHLYFQYKQMPYGELKAFSGVSQAEFCTSFSVRNINFQKSIIFLLCLFILFNLYTAFIGVFGPQTVTELNARIISVDISLFPWKRIYKMQANICCWTKCVTSCLANILFASSSKKW